MPPNFSLHPKFLLRLDQLPPPLNSSSLAPNFPCQHLQWLLLICTYWYCLLKVKRGNAREKETLNTHEAVIILATGLGAFTTFLRSRYYCCLCNGCRARSLHTFTFGNKWLIFTFSCVVSNSQSTWDSICLKCVMPELYSYM